MTNHPNRGSAAKQEREKAIGELRKILKPGQTVYTVLRHVSASGMSRAISLCVVDGPEFRSIDFHVRRTLGYTFDQKHGGLKVGGCGMDMGFHMVYSLGRVLWPEGVGGSKTQGAGERDGGYALRHEWV